MLRGGFLFRRGEGWTKAVSCLPQRAGSFSIRSHAGRGTIKRLPNRIVGISPRAAAS